MLLVGGPRFSNLQMRAGTSHDDEPGALEGCVCVSHRKEFRRAGKGTKRHDETGSAGHDELCLCSTLFVALRCQARTPLLHFSLPYRRVLLCRDGLRTPGST